MPQKKEDLEKLLKLLQTWANEKGNEWFKKELIRIFNSENIHSSSMIEEKITHIEKYLLLDGVKVIDYTSIKNNKQVRDQLTRDSFEMSRYRVGLIKHDIHFEEFCRYAHMQCEELLNYFFLERHNKVLSSIISEIKAFNERAIIKADVRRVSEIGYTIKLIAFYNMQCITYDVYQTCWRLNEIRNNISHRSTTEKKEVANDSVRFLSDANYDLVFVAVEKFLTAVTANISAQVTKKEKVTVFSQNSVLKSIAQKLS